MNQSKKKYNKPELRKQKVDNQISLVMMTPDELTPPPGPFSGKPGSNTIDNNTQNPYKA